MVQPAHAPSTPHQPSTPEQSAIPHQPAAPSPAPATPAPGRPRGTFRSWWSRFLVLIMVAGAGFVFLLISSNRAAQAARVDLGTVTLTTQSIPVETARSGQITAVSVAGQQTVKKGDKLGTIEVTTTKADGEPVVKTLTLTAPHDGIVVDEPVTVGSTLQPGQPFVVLYDPTRLEFVSDIPLKNVPTLARGMIASLKANGLDRTVRASVQRVVPRVPGANPAADDVSPDALRLVLAPVTPQEVRGLVPGLRFKGTVDTRTGESGAPKLVAMPA